MYIVIQLVARECIRHSSGVHFRNIIADILLVNVVSPLEVQFS